MKRDARSTTRVRRLNQRQRKKLRVGEFTEYVFDVELTFSEPIDDDAHSALIDDLFGFIEERGMIGGGFGGRFPLTETSGVITAMERGSPSEDDREAVAQWLRARPEVANVSVHALVDGWHGGTQHGQDRTQ
ncbi:DUF469 family protein [Oxalobacteraceae sp. CFBP 8763]|nr:DUF469 family protein [Oxalobacteraceae sp. CFBP 8763]